MNEQDSLSAIDRMYREMPDYDDSVGYVEDAFGQQISLLNSKVYQYEEDYFDKTDAKQMLRLVVNADGYELICKQLIEALDPLEILEILGAEEA